MKEKDCWNQGFIETVQADISKDLEEYGAADIQVAEVRFPYAMNAANKNHFHFFHDSAYRGLHHR